MGRWGQVIRAFLSRHLLVGEDRQLVPESELFRFEQLLCERQLEKGSSFEDRGDEFALVLSGVLRKFHATSEQRSVTRGFALAGDVLGVESVLTGNSSALVAQAIETSQLLVIHRHAFDDLAHGHPCWRLLERGITEALFSARERRELELLTLTPEQRYEKLRLELPDVLAQVPQYEIASYLGVTPVSLSRIRARRLRRRSTPPPTLAKAR
jgi:CRP-like cAMP-binding protein